MNRHLTLTGPYAGATLCGGERTGNDWHAMYAPLGRTESRMQICRDCLRAYLASFDADESLPEWAHEVRS